MIARNGMVPGSGFEKEAVMETVLRILLIRFGIVVAVLVVVALVIFGIALSLKRRGKLGEAKAKAAPLVRGAAKYLADRGDRSGSKRSGLAGQALNAAGRYLDGDGKEPDRRPHGGDGEREVR